MLIYIGADHQGYKLKEALKIFIKNQGYEIIDVGNDKFDEKDDYPDFAALVARSVSQDPASRRGIVICGSGVGVDMVANKFDGVRSALANNSEQAIASRKDDDSNVLALAAKFLDEDKSKEILTAWLKTPFSKEERHQRRIEKIEEIENNN